MKLEKSSLNVIGNKKFSVVVATLAFLFSVLDADAQGLERGTFRLNLGGSQTEQLGNQTEQLGNPQTEQLGNSKAGNLNSQKSSSYEQSFSKLSDLVPANSLQELGDWPSKNLENSDVEILRSLLRKFLEDLGIDIDEVFPEGLPNYSQLFETVPKGGNYLYSLNELIEAAKKFILEGWMFLTDEEVGFVRQFSSFFDANGDCIIDEEHKKYLPENVFPGAKVEKSRMLSNGCIYIPTENGFYLISNCGERREFDFNKIFNNVFIKPYLESVNAFMQNPNEWTAYDLSVDENNIHAALDGVSLDENFATDEEETEQPGKNAGQRRLVLKNFLKKVSQLFKKKLNPEDMSNIGEKINNLENELSYSENELDEDLINYILRIACLNPEDRKLLRLCLKGKIVFDTWFVVVDRLYVYDNKYIDPVVLEDYNKKGVESYIKRGDVYWIVRDGKVFRTDGTELDRSLVEFVSIIKNLAEGEIFDDCYSESNFNGIGSDNRGFTYDFNSGVDY